MISELDQILAEIVRIRANINSLDVSDVSRQHMLNFLEDAQRPLMNKVDLGLNASALSKGANA